MDSENIIVVSNTNFDKLTANEDKLVIVDFWAPWCGPCRMITPILEQLAEEYPNKIIIGKLNIDEQPELAEKYRISSIPTIQFYKGGRLVDSLIGTRPYHAFKAIVDRYA